MFSVIGVKSILQAIEFRRASKLIAKCDSILARSIMIHLLEKNSSLSLETTNKLRKKYLKAVKI